MAPQCEYLDAIRAELPDDGIFVEDLTQVGYVGRLAFPVYKPRTYIHSGYQGTLGFSYATALGAKVARPDVPVVSVSGEATAETPAASVAMTVPVCVIPETATLYVVPLPVTVAVVAPAVPLRVTSLPVKPLTASLNTTVKAIGPVEAGSACPAA